MKTSKGQWFIISAVIASGIFLGISMMLKDYSSVDTSAPTRMNGDFYFYNIRDQINAIVSTAVTDDSPTCINLTSRLDEFRTTAERALAAKGLLFYMDYTIATCDATNDVKFNYIIASQDQMIYNFSTGSAKDIIG